MFVNCVDGLQVQKTHRKSELEWMSNASCNESSDWRRQNVQCPYEQLQQSLIFRIQLCVSTLSKDQQQSCLVAFTEHFPTTRNLSWVALLDLSAAFDIIDHHHILLDRLQSAFAIRESVIDWIQSFIMNRSQTQLRRWRVDRVCGHLPHASKAAFWDPSSFFYILLMSQTFALWSERSFIYQRYPFVRPLWRSELCSWGSETSSLYRGTRRLGIILL